MIIKESNGVLELKGLLSNENYSVESLLFRTRNKEYETDFSSKSLSNAFQFNIDLKSKRDLFEFDEMIYDLFLIISVNGKFLTEKKKQKLSNKAKIIITSNDEIYYKYPIRLGRFEKTESTALNVFEVEGKECALYKTVKGNVSFRINFKNELQIKPQIKTQIDYLKSRKNSIFVGGKLYTKNSRIDRITGVLIARDSKVEIKTEISTKLLLKDMETRFALNRYEYKIKLDLNHIFKDYINQKDDVFDVFLLIKYHDFEDEIKVRLGKPRFRARMNLKSSSTIKANEALSVNPYYTFKQSNLSLEVDVYEKEVFTYMKRLLRWSWLIRLLNKKNDVWIIGERPYKAQDTGYFFFKYMRENHPEHNSFYVIEKDSPELKNVENLGNIIYYKSKEHIKKTLIANRIVGSHGPDHLFPLRTREFIKKVKAKKVFLQHGIMGIKNMVANYSKNAPGFDTDIFMVSSELEKSIIVNDFDYEQDNVFVTGLSRFDNLFIEDVKVKRSILIIPTWRDWLLHEDAFLKSRFFDEYLNLLRSPYLKELSKKHDFEIVMCLHPNMQKYSHYFVDAGIKVINQGEVDVQYLLKESALMITDYSSVGFDFSFLDKPVIYYQFDRKRVIGKKKSHINLDLDLPGEVEFDLDGVLKRVAEYAENNFEIKEEMKNKSKKFLDYKDQDSSNRIYNVISSPIKSESIIKKVNNNEIFKKIFKKYRKSSYYFPTMKFFYKVAKKILPVDEKLILFESGLGKQFADSPRIIYEEIIRRNLDYKIIWSCNKNIRFYDPNTKRIRKLSPSYYYYLARAKYWVNNQNFPTYIKKRPQTTYLQTWHGTPLKKMLYDIENIMGRTEGYLERVGNAVKDWDYLVSPSRYATNAFRSAFKFKGKILETGYPRNDLFYNENIIEIQDEKQRITQRLNLPENKKLVLYAPTFRDNSGTKKNEFKFNFNMDLYEMKEKLGDDYVILLRTHVAINSKTKIDKDLRDFVFNVSNYSDIQELLLISDILITDYSSVMFDYANTKKPMLFYTYDLEEYRDNIRGFYMDFEKEAPGPLMKDTNDIIKNLSNIENVKLDYQEKYNDFYEKYCSLEDGKATDRIVDQIFQTY